MLGIVLGPRMKKNVWQFKVAWYMNMHLIIHLSSIKSVDIKMKEN